MQDTFKMLSSATRVVLLMLIMTICFLSIRQIPVPQELNNIVTIVVSFFFGTKAGDIVSGGKKDVVLG